MKNNKSLSIKFYIITLAVFLSNSHNIYSSEAKYGEWSMSVNQGNILNTASRDGCQALSRDGLSLYFASDRDTGSDMDLYVAERKSKSEPFSNPQNLGAINAAGSDDVCPTLSYDGHVLYFATDRAGGCGNRDIWMSRRQNANDNFGWGTAIHLGCTVNSAKVDQGSSFYEDENEQKYIFFSSNRTPADPAFGGHNIYSMKLFSDGTPNENSLTLVRELSSPANNIKPFVSKNGKEVYFDSNRNSPDTGLDIWAAIRENSAAAFSPPSPVNILNSAKNDVRPILNTEGTELYFTSNRRGGFGDIDIYKSTRNKIKSDY